MSDFPNVHPQNPVGALSPSDPTCPTGGMILCSSGRSAAASAVWPSANRALFIPVVVPCRVTVFQLGWYNGATASGNVDAGIYDLAGNRLVSTGSIAQAGVSALQLVDTTDTVLPPGNYFLALAMDNITGTIFSSGPGSQHLLRACGVQEQATAFALPSTATFSAPSSNYLPHVVAAIKATL